MTVSDETKKALKGLRTEIVAGMVLVPKTDSDRTWNECADRSVHGSWTSTSRVVDS